jgi:hypothetical protein
VPTVICEGETDNIYLTHAIRSLAKEFPGLAEVTPDNKIRLKVRLYKYPRSSTARLLGLKEGGSGPLSTFMRLYQREISGFTAPGLANPVIILYDNDSGAKSIKSAIKDLTKASPTGTEQFIHVFRNMYALPTPNVGGATESKIEDFFDATTKATIIVGKTFNDGNDADPTKHYGKKVFAHKVIGPKADIIDFTGFRPLLTNLVAAINKHKASTLPKPFVP